MKNESDLRTWLKRAAIKSDASNRITWIEAAPGGTFGMADCLIAVDSELCRSNRLPGNGEGYLLPCELKVVKPASGNLYRADVRPAQVLWHETMAKLGIRTIFLVLVIGKTGDGNVGMIPGCRARQLAKGAPLPSMGFRPVSQYTDAILLGCCGYDFAPLFNPDFATGKEAREAFQLGKSQEKAVKKQAKGRKIAMKSAA